MSRLKKFHVKLNVETLDARELPGYFAECHLYGDYISRGTSMQYDNNAGTNIFTIGYFNWEVNHRAIGYQENEGVTQLFSTLLFDASFTRSHVRPFKLQPPLFNEVAQFIPSIGS